LGRSGIAGEHLPAALLHPLHPPLRGGPSPGGSAGPGHRPAPGQGGGDLRLRPGDDLSGGAGLGRARFGGDRPQGGEPAVAQSRRRRLGERGGGRRLLPVLRGRPVRSRRAGRPAHRCAGRGGVAGGPAGEEAGLARRAGLRPERRDSPAPRAGRGGDGRGRAREFAARAMTATPGSTTGVAPAQEGAAPAPPPAVNLPTFVIRPHRGLVALDLGELWAYRELLWTLVWRELKVRYKQTAIGAAWAVVQPAFSMVLFAIVFGKLAQLPSDGAPYPLFSYAALVPWQFFSRALTEASMSLIAQDRLVTKVYFPRMMVPSAVVLSGVADLAIALLLALALMLYYGHPPGPAFAAIPLFVLLAVIAACGISLWLSALNVSYRDVR